MTEKMQLEDWLDDLCVRFIINLPEEDLSSVSRICFQVEEAQWFYEDFIRPLDPSLPSMSLRSFCLRIFQHCPLLSGFPETRAMQAFEEFLQYKTRVPVRGAILMNHAMDSVVLVKGWKKGANWSFPRGKINKDEDDLDCAIREVYEETGYDIRAAGLVPEAEDVHYIEMTMRDQQMRLYVFRDVPMDTYFEPRTRKEISKIQWYKLSELPAFVKKKHQQNPNNNHAEAAQNANKFYMVAPFLKGLKTWVVKQKQKDAQRISSGMQFMPNLTEEEVMTEEEQMTDSGMPYYANSNRYGAPDASAMTDRSMEDATAALKGLLKIQPPTQGLQSQISSPVRQPTDAGDALLAMLRGNASMTLLNQQQPVAMPQTPLELPFQNPQMPRKPQHPHPRPPQFSTLPPPPSFPIQPEPGSYHLQNNQNLYFNQAAFARQDPLGMLDHNNAMLRERRRREESSQLQHPQPRPPPVQKAVFNGGITNGPIAPQAHQPHHQSNQPHQPHFQHSSSHQQQPPHHIPSNSQSDTMAQFSGVHGPVLTQTTRQPPTKLTSHSLALLNAFKTRDEAADIKNSGDSPLQAFTRDSVQQVAPSPPTNGFGSMSLHSGNQQSDIQASVNPFISPSAAKAPLSEAHKTSLLDMFRQPSIASPPSKPAVQSQGSSLGAVPVTVSSVQQLSYTTVQSENSTTHHATEVMESRKTIDDQTNLNGSRQKPAAGVLFDPKSMLARPTSSTRSARSQRTQKSSTVDVSEVPAASLPRLNGEKLPIGAITRLDSSIKGVDTQPKPFAPQILKRPQQGSPSTGPQTPKPHIDGPTMKSSPLAAGFPVSPAHQPLLDRRPSQAPEHRQALLSLFGKSPAATSASPASASLAGAASSPTTDRAGDIMDRSRVGSLASISASGTTTRRSSQNPMSPADKGFLLDYLNAAVAQDGRKH